MIGSPWNSGLARSHHSQCSVSHLTGSPRQFHGMLWRAPTCHKKSQWQCLVRALREPQKCAGQLLIRPNTYWIGLRDFDSNPLYWMVKPWFPISIFPSTNPYWWNCLMGMAQNLSFSTFAGRTSIHPSYFAANRRGQPTFQHRLGPGWRHVIATWSTKSNSHSLRFSQRYYDRVSVI